MKIGSFWGLPAPMLLLTSKINEDKFNMNDYVDLLDFRLNKVVLQDLHKEFSYLVQSLDSTPFTFKTDLLSSYHNSLIKDCKMMRINNGECFGDFKGYDVDEILEAIYLKIAIEICDIILLEEKSSVPVFFIGESISSTNIATVLKEKIILFLKTESGLSMNGLKVVARKIVDGFRSDDGVLYSDVILKAFRYDKVYNPILKIDGNLVVPSEKTMCIFNWFVANRESLLYLHSRISRASREEYRVFNRDLSDLIRMKPESLKYIVNREFDFLKGTRSRTSARKFISKYRASTAKYKDLLLNHVSPSSSTDNKGYVTNEFVRKIRSEISADAGDCLQQMKDLGYIMYHTTRVQDYEILANLSQNISNVSLDTINRVIGVDYTKQEWESEIIPELNELGICGINFYSKNLFVSSVESIQLISNDKILDNENAYIKRLEILKSIEALLDSMLPIGEVIK